jgi:hypothetical protein
MNIQPIVEGDGEVTALPVLLRRLIQASNAYPALSRIERVLNWNL